jgi:hypothetical protein
MVDVVNGGFGLRRASFFLTSSTLSVPSAAVNNAFLAARASFSLVKLNFVFSGAVSPSFLTCLSMTFSFANSVRRAINGWLFFSTSAAMVQYSSSLKFSISCSRSTISLNAGLCTRHADRPR